MDTVFLGYEMIRPNHHVVDLVIRKEEGQYTLVEPTWPQENVSIKDATYLGLDTYRDGDREVRVLQPYKIKSDGRDYLVVDVEGLREQVILRLHSFKVTGEEYIVRVHMEEEVEHVVRGPLGDVYYTEEGNLDVEMTEKEYIKRNVTVLLVTEYGTGEMNEQVYEDLTEVVKEEGLLNDIIKEVGDSQIALSVVKQAGNMKRI